MKKLIVLFIILVAAFNNVNAQKICCPEFKLVGGIEECRKQTDPGGGSNPHEKDSCDFKACKNVTMPFMVFPNEPGFTYTWQILGGVPTTTTGNPINITWGNGSSGFISIFISNANGTCRDTIKKLICLIDAPKAAFTSSPSSPICNNTAIQFNNTTIGGNTYTWDFGDGTFSTDVNPAPHIFPGPGTYNVVLTASNGTTGSSSPASGQEKECGCKDTFAMTIVVKAESGINIIPGCKKMLCKGDTASYCTTATCNSYNWSVSGGTIIGAANGNCINVKWDGTYPAIVTLNGSCGGTCGNTASLAVPVLYPSMAITGSKIICPSASASYSLPAMPGTFYGWHLSGGGSISGPDSNTSVININWGSAPGTYYLTCYYNNPTTGCSGIAKDTIKILPKYKMTGLAKFCVGDNFNFTANGAGTWTITTANVFTGNGTNNISGTWNAPGTYLISATPTTTSSYCSYPATLQIIVNDTPKLNAILGPLMVCKSSTQVYSISSNINDGIFNWTATGGTIASQMGSHHDSIVVTWGNTLPFILSVTQTVNGCSSSPKQIAIDTFPKPIITGNTTVCANETVTYTVAGTMPQSGWVWNVGGGSAGTIVSQSGNTVQILWNGNVVPGNNTATVEIIVCGVVTAYAVTINTPANITVTKSGNLCNPGVTLTATGSMPCYQWYRNGILISGATSSTYLATLPGYYEVRCPNQCSGYGSIVVPAEFIATKVSITADNYLNYCTGSPINVNLQTASSPSVGCSYQWYKNGILISGQTANTLNVTTSGGYYVVHTCGNCKDTSNLLVVTEGPCNPNCKVTFPQLILGDDLAKNGPADYFENTKNENVFTTGIIINNPTALCNNPSFSANYTLDAPKTFNAGINWNFGDGNYYNVTVNGGFTPPHHYNAVGTYIVTAHFSANCPEPPPTHVCDYYDTIHYTVPIAANFNYFVNCNTVTLTNLSTVLSGCSITSYLWSCASGGTFSSTTAPSPTFTATTTGTYLIKLKVTSSCKGCTDEIIIPVFINAFSATFTPPASGCVDEKIDFAATSGMPHYLWYFGDGSTATTATTSHTYQTTGPFVVSLVVTNNLGCKDSVAHTIIIHPAVTVSAGADKFVCPGSVATLTATGTNISTFQWYNNAGLISGATSATYTNAGYGTYYVIATSINGCTKKSDPVHVYFKAAPIVKIKTDGTNIVCMSGGNGYISLQNIIWEANTNYSWTGSGPGSISFSPTTGINTYVTISGAVGTYQIILSAINTITNCTTKDTLCVFAYSSPTVAITGPVGTLCEGNKYTFTALALPTLGTGSYMYQWGNGIIGNTLITGFAGMVTVTATDPHGCTANAFGGIIKPRADVSLFPVGCDTLCLTDTVHFPLPLGGGVSSSSYSIQWYDSGTPIGTNSIHLPLALIGPGDHHFYAIVTFMGACPDTTGTFDLFVKDCTLLPPCDNCPTMFDNASFTMGTISGNIMQGSFTFTSTKPLKEVRLNVADLKYHWSDPSCKNCKAAIEDRACIYPANASQTVGSLVWDNFTGASIPPSASTTDCPKELIFKLGAALPPGTYSIPLQVSFAAAPKSNCKLIVDKFCMHLAITDEECRVCEKNVCAKVTNTGDDCECSAGNNWNNLYITPVGVGIPKPKTFIFCNSSITGYSFNTPYLLSGMYNCKPGCVAIKNEVVIRNQTGDIIYTHIGATLYENIMFPIKGIYTVTLTAYCGGKKCECKFQISVDKDIIVLPPNGGGNNPPNGNPPTSSANTPTPTPTAIEKVLADILPPDFSGQVLVAKKDSVLYEKYKGNNVNNHTAFDLASVAKTFTAMAILKMVEEKKISLNDDVTKYLPSFPIAGINIKMLLSHKSGIEDYVKFMQAADVDKSNMISNADLLQYIIKNKDKIQTGKPGGAFNYSNTNFAMLALIIEKISGQSYGQYLSEKFFKPLNMEDTYVFTSATAKTATPSYYKNGKAYDLKFLDFIYGDKNIYTTVKDMMKWDKALRDGKVFSKESLSLAYTPNSALIADQSNYGLGWRILLVPNGKKIIYHNGWWHGNRSVFIRLLDEDALIVILSNSSFTTISSSRKLADLFGAYKQTGRSLVNF